MTHDGLGKYLSQVITKAPGPTDDIVGILKSTRTDVVISPNCTSPPLYPEEFPWFAGEVVQRYVQDEKKVCSRQAAALPVTLHS